MKYYIDTNIWRDYYEDRKDPYKNVGEIAFRLLSKLLALNNTIVVSTFLLRELEVDYSIEMIRALTKPFARLFEKREVSEEQFLEAKAIARERDVPIGDAIHAILARDNGALIVTRDKDFERLRDICEYAKPEDII